MKTLQSLVRPNIQALARRKKTGSLIKETITLHLDKGESPFNAPYNRYPDKTLELEMATAISAMRQLTPEYTALTNGTYQSIDLLIRIFCIPQRDNIIIPEPSSEKTNQIAAINDVECRHIHLDENFDIYAEDVLKLAGPHTKAVILTSPNIPTGNLIAKDEILELANLFQGLIIVDESYIDYARTPSLAKEIPQTPNLIIVGSLSKGFASAALRIGFILAHPEIIHYVSIVTPPHPLPTNSLQEGMNILRHHFDVDKWVKWQLEERTKVIAAIKQLPFCQKVYPTDTNFFMLKVTDPQSLQNYLTSQGIKVHDCSSLSGCENCLAITIGLTGDNNTLLGALRRYSENHH